MIKIVFCYGKLLDLVYFKYETQIIFRLSSLLALHCWHCWHDVKTSKKIFDNL